jgi:hypothetical protein
MPPGWRCDRRRDPQVSGTRKCSAVVLGQGEPVPASVIRCVGDVTISEFGTCTAHSVRKRLSDGAGLERHSQQDGGHLGMSRQRRTRMAGRHHEALQSGEANHCIEPARSSRPVSIDGGDSRATSGESQGESHYQRIIGVSEHRDEVGNQVDR